MTSILFEQPPIPKAPKKIEDSPRPISYRAVERKPTKTKLRERKSIKQWPRKIQLQLNST